MNELTTTDIDHLPVAATASSKGAMVEGLVAREVQEVQAALTIAKRFPRDEIAAFNRIMTSCKRKRLAEQAVYAYKRGNQIVTGPSIRLAEAIAQAWGNIQQGIVELEQRPGESTVMAFAWDLETNSRSAKVFTVPHMRYTKQGSYALTDPRDIYELVANQGSRRLRSCILSVIPGDVVDAALEQCKKTLQGANTAPLDDRIRAMVTAFGEIGVNQEMIEAHIGHKADAIIEQELVSLRQIYTSIRDGMAKREDFFQVGGNGDQPPKPPESGRQNLRQPAKENDHDKPATPKAEEPEKEKPTDEPAAKTPEPPSQAEMLVQDSIDEIRDMITAGKEAGTLEAARTHFDAAAEKLKVQHELLGFESHQTLTQELLRAREGRGFKNKRQRTSVSGDL